MSTQYDDIYFNQSRVSGEVRMSTDGLGWRATQKVTAGSAPSVQKPFLLPASELVAASWSRGAHAYMLQIQTKSGAVVSLDGFDADQFAGLQRALSSNLDLPLEHREHSLRGWNWGKLDFERNEMVLNVASKPDFEIRYGQIASSNVVGKSEVAVELELPTKSETATIMGDEVVEMRFYIPGQTQEESKDKDSGDGDEDAGEVVTQAQLFHDQLQERADIGATAGSELAQFSQMLFTTPRGRYDLQFFGESFRLHGKTYDYKVLYSSLQRIFVLPRLDELHDMLVLQLDPPLRQGQTRYPFLVMQAAKVDEMEIELNVDDAEYAEKYQDKIQRHYDAGAMEVISSLFSGLSGRKVTPESSYRSTRNMPAVSCLTKAAEATLYPLDRAILLVSKAPLYVPYTEIVQVRFSRLATGNRTFDMTLNLRGASGNSHSNEIALTGLAKEDQPTLEQFFDSKNLKIRNDAAEARKTRLAELDEDMEMDLDSEEDEDFDAEPEDSSDGSDDSDDSDASGDSDASESESDGDSKKKRRKL